MTVYVDNARIPATVRRIKGRWSHLTADTVEELNEFAARLGLRPSWFQTCKRKCSPEGQPCPHWHFDVVDAKRDEAIRLGAKAIDVREMGAITSARRQALRAGEGQ
ncbi:MULTISPECIES: DUF4031 domain-containing protein [unclassified Micromonospora]|uniref:DUF4031 domain-containing protein n=1 Tax=unclassified Micromonospora TaxID=2617518 RepID=UPI0033D60EB8